MSKIVVYRIEMTGIETDEYQPARYLKVDDAGVLRVIGPGDAVIAAYPDGRWVRATKIESGGV